MHKVESTLSLSKDDYRGTDKHLELYSRSAVYWGTAPTQ